MKTMFATVGAFHEPSSSAGVGSIFEKTPYISPSLTPSDFSQCMEPEGTLVWKLCEMSDPFRRGLEWLR
jgi:hypothetical protein